MLNRSQILTLLKLRLRGKNQPDDKTYSLFSGLPMDIFRAICAIDHEKDSPFHSAIRLVTQGRMAELKVMLDQHPRLVLQSGTITTRAGITIKNKSLLECALGEGNPDMAAMIMPYFDQFEGGTKEKNRQLERYRPCIHDISIQTPYDFSALITIIKESSATDVTEALEMNMAHESNLRDELIKFRNDVKPSTVTTPRMHYDYQTLIHAFKLFDREWSLLYQANHRNHDKSNLILRQIIGYLQRSLPTIDCLAFIGELDVLSGNSKMLLDWRVIDKKVNDLFPDNATEANGKGLGFEYAVYPHNGDIAELLSNGISTFMTKLVSDKQKKLLALLEPNPTPQLTTCHIL